MNRLLEGEKNPLEAEAIHRGGSTNDYGEHRPHGNQEKILTDSDLDVCVLPLCILV